MKNITLFVSDKIRMHPNEITVDGLSIAVEPFLILPLDASDQELQEAITECLQQAKTEVPHRPWQAEETKAYYEKLSVQSQKDLGRGLDVMLEEEAYTLTPIDTKGAFGFRPRRPNR